MSVMSRPSDCPVEDLLRLLMGAWTTNILWHLGRDGPRRFGELKRDLSGVSAKVLSGRLRGLVEAGVIFREVRPSAPAEVRYGLTERGRILSQALESLNDFANDWRQEDRAGANDAAAE